MTPDTNTTIQPQTNQTSQFTPPSDAGAQGISNPPDGGNVSDVGPALPSSGMPSPQGQPAQPQAGEQPTQSAQSAQAPQAAQQPTQTQPAQTGQPAKTPNLSKTQGQPAPAGPPPQTSAASPQAIKRASAFKQIAQVLAGGPQYKYTIDDNGNMQKQEVPVSGKHLGLAIALEALSGAFQGMGVTGPNAAGRAGAQAFAQGEQRVTEQDQQAKAQAQQDFTRRAQALETNLRMRSMARTIDNLDEESQLKYGAQYAPTLKNLQDNAPDFIEGPVSEDDFSKYNVTKENAIPYMRVPKPGPDGKQLEDRYGNKKWTWSYYVVKPGIKLSGLFDKNDMKAAKEAGMSWADNDRVLNSPFEISNFLNIKSKLANWEVSKDAYNQIFKEGDDAAKGEKTDVTHPDFPTRDVKINDPKIESEVNKAAATYNVDPRLVKAVLVGESNQDPNAKSYSGATGLMQLTPGMGKYYPKDPKNPQQNIDAGTHLLADLMRQFKGDPKKALAAYYSGPNAINSDGTIRDVLQDHNNPQVRKDHTAEGTQAYVDRISKIAGLGQPAQSGGEQEGATGENTTEAPKRLSPAEWRAAKDPNFLTNSELFTSALHSLPVGQEGMIGAALAHLQSTGNGNAANKMAAFFNQGDPKFIRDHDDNLQAQRDQVKTDRATAAIEQRAAAKAKADTDAHDKKIAMLNTLETAKVPDNVLQMDPKDVLSNLQKQGVTLTPADVRVAMAVARYEAPMNVASNKLWFKDQSLTQQDVLDVVRQFNPSYDAGNYNIIHSFTSANSKPSQTFQAAAAVSNHLNQLVELAHAVKSGAGQYPLINKLENELNYHTGGTDYSRLQALTAAVNDEMGRVLSGGFAPQKGQIEQIMDNMTAQNSDKQIEALAKLYTGIMHGKVAPYDEQYNKLSGAADKHLQNIPESFDKLSRKYGYETPWNNDKQGSQNQENTEPKPPVSGAIAGRDAKGNIVAWRIPDGKGGYTVQRLNQTQQ